jgi:hypothetical protein
VALVVGAGDAPEWTALAGTLAVPQAAAPMVIIETSVSSVAMVATVAFGDSVCVTICARLVIR